MIFTRTALAASLATLCAAGTAAETPNEPTRTLGVVTVTGVRPTSLPTQIPTTMEGVTRDEIEKTINATDSEDAVRSFPSLLVRKRYIGDYNHAVLSSRASGTGNSARSAVYADGILLSNYLGNGATYAPRWGLVTPEEIERVDVMYGPFSAAYPATRWAPSSTTSRGCRRGWKRTPRPRTSRNRRSTSTTRTTATAATT